MESAHNVSCLQANRFSTSKMSPFCSREEGEIDSRVEGEIDDELTTALLEVHRRSKLFSCATLEADSLLMDRITASESKEHSTAQRLEGLSVRTDCDVCES